MVLDGQTFELKGNWEKECEAPPSGYEFWFQPCHNVLISSSGIAPKIAGYGFCPDDYNKGERTGVLSQNPQGAGMGGNGQISPQTPLFQAATGRAVSALDPGGSSSLPLLPNRCRFSACSGRSLPRPSPCAGVSGRDESPRADPPLVTRFSFSSGIFGRHIYVWDLSCRSIIQCIDLGEDSLPLSVKFLHNPNAAEGYVSCALSGVIYRFYKCEASACATGEPRAGDSGGTAGGLWGHRGGSARAARVPRAERQLGRGRGDSHPGQGGDGLDHAQDARLVWPRWGRPRPPGAVCGGTRGGCWQGLGAAHPPGWSRCPGAALPGWGHGAQTSGQARGSGAACSVPQPSSWTSSSPGMTSSCTSATGGTETSASTSCPGAASPSWWDR